MLSESISIISPPEIETVKKGLQFNPESPYKRIIEKIKWVDPNEIRYLFHTAGAELNSINPALCKSFDYVLFGKVLPVTFVLPYPHVNRVRDNSEKWSSVRKEAQEKHGYSHGYLRMPHGQIRMGSTMLDQYLLAAQNTGLVFEVNLTEIGNSKNSLREYISLAEMPIIDAFQFADASPVGLGTGGLESHYPGGICHPDYVGYHQLQDYLEHLKDPKQKAQLIDMANKISGISPTDKMLHGVFQQLMQENVRAVQTLSNTGRRLIIYLKPIFSDKISTLLLNKPEISLEALAHKTLCVEHRIPKDDRYRLEIPSEHIENRVKITIHLINDIVPGFGPHLHEYNKTSLYRNIPPDKLLKELGITKVRVVLCMEMPFEGIPIHQIGYKYFGSFNEGISREGNQWIRQINLNKTDRYSKSDRRLMPGGSIKTNYSTEGRSDSTYPVFFFS